MDNQSGRKLPTSVVELPLWEEISIDPYEAPGF